MEDKKHTLKPRSDVTSQRTPSDKPPFTLQHLKKSIPSHCFDKSLIRSLSYLIGDFLAVIFLSYVATSYFHLLPTPASHIAWACYWATQGFVFVGLFVLAHECGHQAFSPCRAHNELIGFLIHSFLLVPYFSWKISHRNHHSSSGLLERDETFVPMLKCQIPSFFNSYLDNPLGRGLLISTSCLAGWPMYLLCNMTGRSYGRLACHFDPYSPMYSDHERVLILLSDAGVIAWAWALYKLGNPWVLRVYSGPLLVCYGTVVVIVYLQHTHVAIPRYDVRGWDWMRGSLATVDRDYGAVLNRVFHHIGETHVVHHLFPGLPHYHAVEATREIRHVLGEYYRWDDTPILKALWREVRECRCVEADGDVEGLFWFNNTKL